MTTWYCALPFRHAYVDSQGISACCKTPRHNTTLDNWHQNPALLELQKKLLNNQQPQECKGCHEEEQIQGRSLRTDANQDYNHEIFQDTLVDFIDFRSVNICNFKCRSCNPVFSHGIGQEVKNNTQLQKYFKANATKTVEVTDENISWIMDNLGSMKRIMLTGGEPTVIPGIKDLINQIAQHHKHIMIMITSNASFCDDFWFEITQTLPNLHWTVSIDAVGHAAEIVRHGSDWSVIQSNVTWLAQHAQSLDINSVVTNLSVFGLGPLLQFGRNMQRLSVSPSGRHGDLGCRHQFFVCQRPYWLSADNLSPELLPPAIEYLKDCLMLDLDSEQQNMLQGLINQLECSKYDPDLWARSQLYNHTLDSIRNENHLSLYTAQS